MANPVYDVLLGPDGDLPEITQHITGIQLVMQRVKVRLQTFLGEWILDTSKGLDYHGWAQIRPAPVNEIQALMLAEVLGTPGVVRVPRWEVTFDKPGRTITIDGDVETEDGVVPVTVSTSPTGTTGNAWSLWTIAYTLPL
jgi:hypothetical protein